MLQKLHSLFSFFQHGIVQDIGIDLGTANTVVFVQGKGIVIQAPSVVARHIHTKAILAIGLEAKRMRGRTPRTLEAVRPLRDGVIADFDAAEAMLDFYIREVTQRAFFSSFIKPRVVIGIPSGTTEVERRAVCAAAHSAGAGKVWLIEEPIAAALGAGIRILEPEGCMIVDIGGGTTEIAVLALGGVVVSRSLRCGGDALDEAVITFVRTKYGVLIGEATAEQTKIAIGSAYPFESLSDKKEKHTLYHVVRGRDISSGLPKSIKMSSIELREALAPIVHQIIRAAEDILQETPPDLMSDIIKHGITLAGGTAQLRGLELLLGEELQMPVWIVSEPQLAVARGCGLVLDHLNLLERCCSMCSGVRKV